MWVTVLGLPDELYWDSSPREIDACFMEYYRSQDTVNARYGTIAASIFNAVPVDAKQARRRKWLDWKSFFRPLTSQTKQPSRDEVTERARQDVIKMLKIGSFKR